MDVLGMCCNKWRVCIELNSHGVLPQTLKTSARTKRRPNPQEIVKKSVKAKSVKKSLKYLSGARCSFIYAPYHPRSMIIRSTARKIRSYRCEEFERFTASNMIDLNISAAINLNLRSVDLILAENFSFICSGCRNSNKVACINAHSTPNASLWGRKRE